MSYESRPTGAAPPGEPPRPDSDIAMGGTVAGGTVRGEAVRILRLAGPLVAGQLATVAMSFVDAAMAGRLGAEALAAVAVGAAVWAAVMIFSLGVLLAVPPAVSQLEGAGREVESGSVARQAGWLALGLAAVSVGFLFTVEPILRGFGVDPAIVPTIIAYLRAVALGLPALYLFLVLRFLSEGLSHTRPAMYFGVLGLGINVVGNWSLMFGHLGMPALGAVGCGYATALVFWIQLAAMTIYVAWGRRYRALELFAHWELPDPRMLGELLAVGLPIGVAVFIEASLFAIVALLMGTLGTEAVAGHQIAINFASLTFMVPLGIAMAITVRVGSAAGRGDARGVARAGWTGVGLALAAQSVAAAVMILAPELVVGLYTTDPEVTRRAVDLLFLAAIFQLSDGLQVSASGALRGLKDTRAPMVITLFAYWLVGLPAGWWLTFGSGLGPRGLWIGIIAGLTIAGLLLALRFGKQARRWKRRRDRDCPGT